MNNCPIMKLDSYSYNGCSNERWLPSVGVSFPEIPDFQEVRDSRAHNLTEISVILDFLPFFWDCARLITKSTYKIIFRKSQKKTWHPCRGPTLYLAGVQLFFLLWNTASKVQNFLQFNQICDKMCEFSAKSFNPKIFLRSLKISKNVPR